MSNVIGVISAEPLWAEWRKSQTTTIASNFETILDAPNLSPRTVDAIRKALDYDDVIVKCGHCSQWGAVKTACKYCGAPIG